LHFSALLIYSIDLSKKKKKKLFKHAAIMNEAVNSFKGMTQISALLLERLHHHINFGKEREKTAASADKEKIIIK
jgi:hypothetical protein